MAVLCRAVRAKALEPVMELDFADAPPDLVLTRVWWARLRIGKDKGAEAAAAPLVVADLPARVAVGDRAELTWGGVDAADAPPPPPPRGGARHTLRLRGVPLAAGATHTLFSAGGLLMALPRSAGDANTGVLDAVLLQ